MPITPATKILFLITKGNWGGAQRAVFDLATSLPKTAEVVVACGEGDALPKKLAEADIRCERLPALGRNVGIGDFAAFCDIRRLIRVERPDILHLHSSKAALLGALASRLVFFLSFLTHSAYPLAPRIIFTVHGWPFNEPRSFLERILLWPASWFTALCADVIIVLCRADFQSARRMPFIARKTRLIPNGLAPRAFKERRGARHILVPDATPDTALIVTIAELTRNKGLSYALRAVSALSHEEGVPPFRCIIVGDGEERAALERIIAEEKLSGIVRLAGFIPDAASLLSGADIFLLPSLKEGLPYVLLEAGGAGLPVVAINVGGVSDIIDDMHTGLLIRPKREKEIVDALRFLLLHRKKREELGVALRSTVLRNFSFAHMREQTLALYELHQPR